MKIGFDRSYLSIYSYDVISDCGYSIIYPSMYLTCVCVCNYVCDYLLGMEWLVENINSSNKGGESKN